MDRKLYLSNQAFENISQLDTLKPLFKTGAITCIASKGKVANTLIGAMIHNETANHKKRVAVVLCYGNKSEFIYDFITPTGLPMAEMSDDEYNKGSICIIGDRDKSIHIERVKERLREFKPDMIFILDWDCMISDELLPRTIVKEFNVPIALTGQMQLDYHDPFKKTDKFGLDIYDFDMLEMVDIFVVAHKPEDSDACQIKTYKHPQKRVHAKSIKIKSIPFVDFGDYLGLSIERLVLSHTKGRLNILRLFFLKELQLKHCHDIKQIDLSDCNQIEKLTVRYCDCQIDLSGLTALKELIIGYCPKIKKLDFTKNQNLEALRLEGLNICALNLSPLKSLKKLECVGLKISKLDFNHYSSLERLNVAYCDNLTSLDFSKCRADSFNCEHNSKLSKIIVRPYNVFQAQGKYYESPMIDVEMNITDSEDD